MAENSGINWTDHSFAPWFGCTEVSEACRGCYAREMMETRFHKATWGAKEERVLSAPSAWKNVRSWDRKAAKEGRKRFVFCSHLSDVYDNAVDPEWRERLFALMRECPNLIFLVLTKRPGNILKMSKAAGGLPSNVWLGCTVIDQVEADREIPKLLQASGMLGCDINFLSIEPMLGPIDLRAWLFLLDWIIAGFETDQGVHMARPGYPGWGRSLARQCAETGTAFWWKQNGMFLEEQQLITAGIDPRSLPKSKIAVVDNVLYGKVGKDIAGRILDGQEHNGRPNA